MNNQVLPLGSIIHWSEIKYVKDKSGTNRKMVSVQCRCGFSRFWRYDMVLKKLRTNEYTGCCKNCFKTLTWKEKHRLRPARRKLNDAGYMKIFIPENPMADKRGEVYEHRFIMSQILNRPLEKWEHVHHKDGNRSNNSPKNLELVSTQQNHSMIDMSARIKYLENLLAIHKIPF